MGRDHGAGGLERLSGEQAVTWVDRRLGSLGDRLTMGSGQGAVSVDPRSDLRAGLVPGSGFVLTTMAGDRGVDVGGAATASAPQSQAGTAQDEAGAAQNEAGAAQSGLSQTAGGEAGHVDEPGPGAAADEVEPVAAALVAFELAASEARVADFGATGPAQDEAGATGPAQDQAGATGPAQDQAGATDRQAANSTLAEAGATDLEPVGVGTAEPADGSLADLQAAGTAVNDAVGAEPEPAEPGPAEAEVADAGVAEAPVVEGEPEQPGAADPAEAEPGPVGRRNPTVAEPIAADLSAEPTEAQSGGAPYAGPTSGSWWDAGAAETTAAPAVAATSTGDLVSPDGMRIPLDRDYVLGREPDSDPSVANGAATPVRLTDDDNLISRIQSYITVQGGQVTLKDAASANGTYVAAPGAPVWTRLGADPVVLPPTWSIRVGNRVFTYVAP